MKKPYYKTHEENQLDYNITRTIQICTGITVYYYYYLVIEGKMLKTEENNDVCKILSNSTSLELFKCTPPTQLDTQTTAMHFFP